MTDWGIKYRRDEIVQLTKQTGETVKVHIEGHCYRWPWNNCERYSVREIGTRREYIANQADLQKIPAKSAGR